MQSGIVLGYLGLVEGVVTHILHELGEKARVIATGSYAEIIAAKSPVIEVVDPQLTMVGLRLIHELNRPKF
jgi:type III pantothenate kinase